MVLDSLIFRSRRSSALALIATVSISGIAALGASAGSASATTTVAPCTTRVESTPFAQWGDTNPYFLMPNGTFETGSDPWTLTGGAAVVTGNESFFAAAKTDSHSLQIPSGGQATSQTICVGRGESSFRLFVYRPGVTGAILHVQVNVQNPVTGQAAQSSWDVISTSMPAGWSPTIRMHIPNVLGGATGTENLTVNFSTRGSAATWNIDDVFVDPFKMR